MAIFLKLKGTFLFIQFSEIGDFQKIVGTFIEMVDVVAKEVEQEKMKVNILNIILTLGRFSRYMILL